MEPGQWIMCHRDLHWWRGEIVDVVLGGTTVLLAPAFVVRETGEFSACVGGAPHAQEQCVQRGGRPLRVPLIGTVVLPCEPSAEDRG